MDKSIDSKIASHARMIVPLFVVAGLLFAGGGALLFWQFRLQCAADKEFADKSRAVGTDNDIAKRYQSAFDDYHSALAPLQHLETPVSANSFVPTLVQQLHQLSTADNIDIIAIKPEKSDNAANSNQANAQGDKKGKPSLPPPYTEAAITVQAEGNFNQIMRFMNDLNKFPKIVTIKSIALTPKTKADGVAIGGSPRLTANLGLMAYLFQPSDTSLFVDSKSDSKLVTTLRSIKADYHLAQNADEEQPLKAMP